jgi:hypothetical protein
MVADKRVSVMKGDRSTPERRHSRPGLRQAPVRCSFCQSFFWNALPVTRVRCKCPGCGMEVEYVPPRWLQDHPGEPAVEHPPRQRTGGRSVQWPKTNDGSPVLRVRCLGCGQQLDHAFVGYQGGSYSCERCGARLIVGPLSTRAFRGVWKDNPEYDPEVAAFLDTLPSPSDLNIMRATE